MINFGGVPAGSVLPVLFTSYDANGASVTLSGLAVTDIEIYKGASMTQRASDAGYTLLDTDGIDIDSVTGLHGFSIDTGDNTDSGFFAAGSFYTVVVSAVTIASQAVTFIAATFRLVAAENTAGVPVADATRIGGTAQTGRDIGASVLLSNGTGTGQVKLASGYVAMTWADIGSPTTTVNLSGTTISTSQAVASVAAVSSGAISEASYATTAGGFAPLGIVDQGTAQSATSTTLRLRAAAAFANDELIGAVVHITGGSTGVGQSRLITDYDSTTDTATVDPAWTTTPSGTITYKVFVSPPADSTVTAVKAVTDKLNTTLESASGSPGEYRFTADALVRAPSGSFSGPTAAAIADAVWDEAISGHAVSGSTGEALSAAGAAGDPWITALPGSYSSGQAGYIIGTNLNATVSSRASQTSLDTLDDFVDTEVAAIKAKTDNLPASPAAVSDIPTATQNADALLNRDMSAVSDTNARSPLNALRFIRNKWSIAAGTLTVTKENDSTTAWTASVSTTAGADPVTGNDPT